METNENPTKDLTAGINSQTYGSDVRIMSYLFVNNV